MSAPVSSRIFDVERAQGDPDVQLVGELGADAAGRLARRSGAERVALDEHDVFDAVPAQVERRSGSERPAADDDDVGARV